MRAVWLVGYRLAQLAGADVLGLARVRDRLLKRLLDQGLQAQYDLPLFLKTHGLKDSWTASASFTKRQRTFIRRSASGLDDSRRDA